MDLRKGEAMTRRSVETQESTATLKVALKLRNGAIVQLPRKTLRREGKDPVTITDFSSVNPCERCDTAPRSDGSLPSSAGFLRVYVIQAGIWVSYVGACDCVFGSWRTIERHTSDGAIPATRYADDIPGVPPGLTNAHWTLLFQFHHEGDDYHRAAHRVPDEFALKTELVRMIGAWECASRREVPGGVQD